MKGTITQLTEVPEALRGEYEFHEADKTFRLKVDGALPGFARGEDLAAANARITEFRDNNIKLLKALGADSVDAALTRAAAVAGIDTVKLTALKDIDPEEHKALKAKAAKLKDKGVDDPDQVDARFKAMLDAAIKPVNDKLAKTEADLVAARKKADDGILRQAVAEKFLRAGGKPKALDFVVGKAAEAFQVQDGAVRALPTKFSADKPGEALGIEEWLAGQAKEADFAFEPSRGAAASGSNGTSGSPARPGVRQLVNPSAQDLGKYAREIAKGEVVIVSQ